MSLFQQACIRRTAHTVDYEQFANAANYLPVLLCSMHPRTIFFLRKPLLSMKCTWPNSSHTRSESTWAVRYLQFIPSDVAVGTLVT